MADCIVCDSPSASPFQSVKQRDYLRCTICQATFLTPLQMPRPAEERAHYAHHENTIDDPGYRTFLNKLAQPLLGMLPPNSEGLDYGCGPGPALAAMLQEKGHRVRLYDPFFAPDKTPLSAQYDFVTCTEVAEHFHTPAAEFTRLRALIKPGGWLAVMTCFQTDDAKFSTWHYRADPTHVVFYRAETFQHLAAHWGWHCQFPAKDIALLQKT